MRKYYSKLAINMAMDIVVNKYLDDLPPYATTLEWVNKNYGVNLPHQATFEFYVEKLQAAIDKQNKDMEATKKKVSRNDDSDTNQTDYKDMIQTEYNIANTHDIWEESSELDDKTLKEFTEKVILSSEKGNIHAFIEELIIDFKNSEEDLPWNLYLNQLMGTVESNKKKTITRRNRRQPERLDLRGELRSHKAKVIVAVDISGSISGEEFKQAMIEVIRIVKNYSQDITVLECDDKIRRD
jgi:predicted metal-dependent peptidase